MHSTITYLVARERVNDLRRAAELSRRSAEAPRPLHRRSGFGVRRHFSRRSPRTATA